jgi:hypothetical protein
MSYHLKDLCLRLLFYSSSSFSFKSPKIHFLVPIFNSVGLRRISNYEEHTVETFKRIAPNITEDVSSPVFDQPSTTHCECVLVLYMKKRFGRSHAIETGVSKSSCWPCAVYFYFVYLFIECIQSKDYDTI